VTIDEFERCLSLLLALARSRGLKEVAAGPRDYYWTVVGPEWVEMTKEPKLAVGSLDDDVSELGKLLEEPGRASSIDFDRAAALLRLISNDLAS